MPFLQHCKLFDIARMYFNCNQYHFIEKNNERHFIIYTTSTKHANL